MARSMLVLGACALLPALSTAAPTAGGSWAHQGMALAQAVQEEDMDSGCEVNLLQTHSEAKRRNISRPEILSVTQAGLGDAAPPEKLSVSAHATIILVGQFLVGHFLCVVLRLWNSVQGDGKARAFGEVLMGSWAMVPLLGVLLVTAQMRSDQLTSLGQPWVYGVPEWWAEISIQVAVGMGVLAMVFRLLTLMTRTHKLISSFFAGCCALCSAFQFLGFGVTLMSTVFMEEPFDIWLNHGRINISLVLASMQHIIIQAFAVNLVWMVAGSVKELAAAPEQSGADVISRGSAAGSLAQSMAPMICILFAAARLRLLDVRHVEDEPRDWVRAFFYLAVNAALLNMLFVIVATVVREVRAGKPDSTSSSVGATMLRALIGLASLAMLTGVVGVLASIFLQQDPQGSRSTSEFSCVLTCMLVLAIQYFGVQLASFLGNLCKCRGPEPGRASRVLTALTKAEEVNSMCPILCCLFLAASARAAEFGASPQGWVQNCMYGCIAASNLSLILSIATSMAAETPSTASDEEPKEQNHRGCASLIAFLQVVSLGVVYAAAAAVTSGLFKMSAETLAVVK